MDGAMWILAAGLVLLHFQAAVVTGLVDGNWSSWTSWECSVTCGTGQDVRSRDCVDPAPSGGGADCAGDGLETGSPCTLSGCPVDGAWSSWASMGCDVSCGDGTITLVRDCDSPPSSNGGLDCPGDATKTGAACNQGPCPVDGAWSTWNTWSCSVTCGDGTLSRDRTCDNPAPANGGADCPGDDSEAGAACNQGPCPAVNGMWSSWVTGSCTVTCGGGTSTKTRTCDNPAPENGGTDCPGDASEAGPACNEDDCPVDGVWSTWTSLTCDVTCGGGTSSRTRACDNPPPANGGNGCAGSPSETGAPCGESACPVDGAWSTWNTWSCSVTCGDGTQSRDRTCDNPAPANGGADCPGDASEAGDSCSEDPCPVDGAWSSWNTWSCSVTCGDGTQNRERTCDNPAPAHGGADCPGSADESGTACAEDACPVDGAWSTWNTWSCSVTCGDGAQSRDRTCDNPAPANGGADCPGDAEEAGAACSETPCPVDGAWSSWNTWACNADCGEGLLARDRTCDDPAPAHGGDACTGPTEETGAACTADPCPVDGEWSTWNSWVCSTTCGHGIQNRARTCDNPEPAHGGADCPGDADESGAACNEGFCPGVWSSWDTWACNVDCGDGVLARERTCEHESLPRCSDPPVPEPDCTGDAEETGDACTADPCPVDGAWSSWGAWSCSVTCGEGVLTRTRACDDPEPLHGGEECPGLAEEIAADCSSAPCPVDGGWSEWSSWWCGAECGEGVLTRARVCDRPEPENGGQDCEGEFLEKGDVCNGDPCVVDGVWSSWSSWGSCSVTCGAGSRGRARACDDPAPANGGADCEGDAEEEEECEEGSCSVALGETCNPSEETACQDQYAVCSYVDDLAGTYCQCRLGTVRLHGDTSSCRLVLDLSDDPDCETCIENNGQCYADETDEDEMGGCLCPADRATVDEPCDTELDLSSDCGAEAMTVCYNENDAEIGLLDLLEENKAKIYTAGHMWDESCHFTEDDEAFCLTLRLEDADCGLVAENSPDELTYSVRVRLQKSESPSAADLNFRATCTFNKRTEISSRDISVVGEENLNQVEGNSGDANVILEVSNAEDPLDTSLDVGEPLKIAISLDEDDVYTSLRAEVCVITDSADVTSDSAQTVYFLQNGCPTGPLQEYVTIFHDFGAAEQEIFLDSTPQFSDDATGLIYVNCAVKTCILPEECAPKSCDTIERRRRDTARGHHVSEELLYWFHQPGLAHKVASIRIREDDEKPRAARHSEGGFATSTLEDLPTGIVAAPIVLAAVIIVAAATTIFYSIRRQQPANIP